MIRVLCTWRPPFKFRRWFSLEPATPPTPFPVPGNLFPFSTQKFHVFPVCEIIVCVLAGIIKSVCEPSRYRKCSRRWSVCEKRYVRSRVDGSLGRHGSSGFNRGPGFGGSQFHQTR